MWRGVPSVGVMDATSLPLPADEPVVATARRYQLNQSRGSFRAAVRKLSVEKLRISHTVRVLGEFSAVRTVYDIGRPNREPAFGVSRLCLGAIGRP